MMMCTKHVSLHVYIMLMLMNSSFPKLDPSPVRYFSIDLQSVLFAAQDHFAIRYRESQSNDEQAACVVLLVSLCEVFSAKYVVAQ